MVIVYAMPEKAKQQAISDTYKLLEGGSLQHRIAYDLPFEEMAQSHELIERGGFSGCVVVSIDK
jgi:NADPH2:quinone reductase